MLLPFSVLHWQRDQSSDSLPSFHNRDSSPSPSLTESDDPIDRDVRRRFSVENTAPPTETAPFLSSSHHHHENSVYAYFRPRRRRTLVLFCAILISLLFFAFQSRSNRTHCISAADSGVGVVPTVTVTAPGSVATMVIDREVKHTDPVVFSLIMWSWSSAAEGAILIKVFFPDTLSSIEPFV